MIEELKLTNFRQHTDLTVTLTAGLNVIRGLNESGKSTLAESISYAMYGARALREPLEDTVTWGQPASTLKVELKFSFEGVQGVVKRGKSGAEAKYGSTHVTGHAEVTKFFEGLFRTSAAMASNLQIASQNKVRGAIEGGGRNAVELIESLADFSLLETIIDKVQSGRPCGNTSTVVDRIARLEAQLQEPVPPEPGNEAVLGAMAALNAVAAEHTTAKQALAALVVERAEAQAQLTRRASALAHREAAALRLADVEQALAQPVPARVGSEQEAETLRAAQLAEQDRSKLLLVYNKPKPRAPWVFQGNAEQFKAELKNATDKYAALRQELHNLQLRKVAKAALRINETSCSLCKKSLSDVPEVVEINGKVDAELAEIAKLEEVNKAETATVDQLLTALRALEKIDNTLAADWPSLYWTHSFDTFPRTVTWTGSLPSPVADERPFNVLIRQMMDSWQANTAAVAKKEALAAEKARLEVAVAAAIPEAAEAEETLKRYEAAAAAERQLEMAVAQARSALVAKEQAYRHVVEMRQQLLAAKAKVEQDLETAKKEVKDMTFFNELIRKVRAARPAVANKLWSLVLSAVSHYTGMGRCEPSAVTRDDKGFLINGKAVTGYSGSAQDVLGMAIRLALVNTFLPSTPFMIMDEIAAACDDDRELSMLGMVMAANIPQVLLVTHSPAAESFAANLVQL